MRWNYFLSYLETSCVYNSFPEGTRKPYVTPWHSRAAILLSLTCKVRHGLTVQSKFDLLITFSSKMKSPLVRACINSIYYSIVL